MLHHTHTHRQIWMQTDSAGRALIETHVSKLLMLTEPFYWR